MSAYCACTMTSIPTPCRAHSRRTTAEMAVTGSSGSFTQYENLTLRHQVVCGPGNSSATDARDRVRKSIEEPNAPARGISIQPSQKEAVQTHELQYYGSPLQLNNLTDLRTNYSACTSTLLEFEGTEIQIQDTCTCYLILRCTGSLMGGMWTCPERKRQTGTTTKLGCCTNVTAPQPDCRPPTVPAHTPQARIIHPPSFCSLPLFLANGVLCTRLNSGFPCLGNKSHKEGSNDLPRRRLDA